MLKIDSTTITTVGSPPQQPYLGENQPIACNRFIIAIPGYPDALQEYTESTGETIDEYELIKTALRLTNDVRTVDALLNQHITRAWLCYKTMVFTQEYVQLITEVVTALRNQLVIHRLYRQDKLPYQCEELLGNRLLLCTREAYKKRLINALRSSEISLF